MKVLVGLSGGVDSAVATYLLQQQGHEVVAGFMLNYMNEDDLNCTTKADLQSFHEVRQHLGISQYEIFDYREEYEQRILNYIYEGYQQGITPNPDVYCNSLVKFDLFLQEGLSMGFDAIATGHYAQIIPHEGIGDYYALYRGIDHRKDQSYFLSQLNQQQLSSSLLPLGGLTKPQVRQIACDINLPNAHRPDSQGLCFIGKISMADFLRDRLGEQHGPIVLLDGTVVGSHTGAYQYTIGQRRNLKLPFQAYVVGTDPHTNTVIITSDQEDPHLYCHEIIIHHRHTIIPNEIIDPTVQYGIKIRYRQDIHYATIYDESSTIKRVVFNQSMKGVAPGQILVCYDGERVIGSGVISIEKK